MNPLKSLIFLLTLSAYLQSAAAQDNEKAFYRLNIANTNNELMVVKIKGRDFWVTPGLYSPKNQFEISKLMDLASGYGLIIDNLTFHGEFLVKPDVDKPYSTRYFYRATALNKVQEMPEYIDEIKWLPLEEALNLITFPHISYLIRQTETYQNKVWSATIDRFKEGDAHKIKVVKDFSEKTLAD